MLDVEKAQKSQQSSLRSDENNDRNIVNNDNVHFKSDDSISEQNENHYFFNTSRTFIINLKAEYDS